MGKRIEWADAFKGGLILLVVFGHCIQSVFMHRNGDFLNCYLWNLIYPFHMPVFMAMSGFLAFRPNSRGGEFRLYTGIYRRMRRLIVPFLIWSIIMFVVNHNVVLISDYVLYPNKSYWFLWSLFFIVMIFNIVDFISMKIHIRQEVAIIGTAIILVGIRFMLPDSKLLGFEYISYYFLFYIMGYYLHKNGHFIPRNSWVLGMFALLWFFLGSFYVAKGVPSIVKWIPYVPGSILSIFYRVTTATVFIFMILGIGHRITVGKSKIWQYFLEFGNSSLGVYVVHMVLRGWLVKSLNNMMPWCPDWTLIIISFILLSTISLWLVQLLGKWEMSATWLLGKV